MSELSVIGSNSVIRGNIRGEGSIEVLGRVEGDIEVSGEVIVGEEGVVLGNIVAGLASLSGEISGNVSAEEAIVLGATARVEGDLIAGRVAIGEGAFFNGAVRMTGGSARPQRNESRQEARPETRSLVSRTAVARPAPVRARSVEAAPLHKEAPRSAPVAKEEAPAARPAAAQMARPAAKTKSAPAPVAPAIKKGARGRKKVAKKAN